MEPKKPSEFTLAMYALNKRIKSETGYNPTAFAEMLFKHGGEETAFRLIHAPKQSEGYTKLFMMSPSRLDLTVEAVVVENLRWRGMFSEDTVRRATDRLTNCGYVPRAPR